MRISMITVTEGDRLGLSVVRSLLAAQADVATIAAALFELAHHNGALLEDLVAVAAQATSDTDPTWALAAWAELAGTSWLSDSTSETINQPTWDVWGGGT